MHFVDIFLLIKFFNIMQKNLILLTLLSVFFLVCCSPNGQKREEQKLSGISIEPVQIQRYEKALFTLNPDSLGKGLRRIAEKFPVFLDAELHDTLNIIQLHEFVTNPLNIRLYDSVVTKYPTLTHFENQFTKAFKWFRYYFPGKEIPDVNSYVSGLVFDYPVQFIRGDMIIALDMYLGENMEVYRKMGIPRYKIMRMNSDYIVRDGIYELYYYHFLEKPGKNVLEKMISKGKHLYFLDALLPNTPDHKKIGYPEEKLQWCIRNERNLWAFMIENELLYASDAYTLRKFFNDGPFTSQFSNDSPARLGEWLGWQIIRAFMKNNPQVTLKQLLKINDPQEILKRSGYKPSNK